MTKHQNPPILSQLCSARTYVEQAEALRALKNETIGHARRKEVLATCGVLEPVVQILAACLPHGKLNGKDPRFRANGSGPRSEDERVRLQAIQALSTFANGGPSVLYALYTSGSISAILNSLSPLSNPPQIVHASLRALDLLADAAALVPPGSPFNVQKLADSLLTSAHIHALHAIFTATSQDRLAEAQVTLAARLVSRLCMTEEHRAALAKPDGVLDALATRLASFAVSEGLVIPGTEFTNNSDSSPDAIPEPAPRCAKISPILRAIAVVVGESKYRAFMLVTSPAILAVFPVTQFPASPAIKAAWQSALSFNTTQIEQLNAMDYLLPAVPSPRSSRRQGRKSGDSKDRKSGTRDSIRETSRPEAYGRAQVSQPADAEGPESPLIPYLIYLSRSEDDMLRLTAISVLVPLVKANFVTKPIREVTLALLVVPTLVGLIKAHLEKQCQDDARASVDNATKESWEILELAPILLSGLTVDNEVLLQAACSCNAVEVLTDLIKEAYKPAISSQPRMWSPQPEAGIDAEEKQAPNRATQTSYLPLLRHRIELRAAALRAICSVAASREVQTSLVDLGTVPYIVESLSQWPGKPLQAKERPKRDKSDESGPQGPKPGYGENPPFVIKPACHVVRMLSRSVAILRTVLVDYSVFLPMYKFIDHKDIELQIVSMSVIANLVTECSPMREPLFELNIMRTLCAKIRSSNAALCLNALWALKHLIHALEPSLKKSCLEELEPGLLVRLITGGNTDNGAGTRPLPGSPELPGDTDDTDEDVDMQLAEEHKAFVFGSNGRGTHQEGAGTGRGRSREVEERLARYRESEVDAATKAREDDLAIQEQGLRFIQNFIMGTRNEEADRGVEPETTEMVDFLFSEIGQERLFSILESKLRPRIVLGSPVVSSSPRRGSSGNGGGGVGGGARSSIDSRKLYPRSNIVAAVTSILVHIAASAPRHRQLVVAQTSLLSLLGAHFHSADKEVRSQLCHLLQNLTWLDDADDAAGCGQRALELKRLGFVAKVEALAEEDPELEVREVAKGALWQLNKTY